MNNVQIVTAVLIYHRHKPINPAFTGIFIRTPVEILRYVTILDIIHRLVFYLEHGVYIITLYFIA
jgi:hypothetical protein